MVRNRVGSDIQYYPISSYNARSKMMVAFAIMSNQVVAKLA
ncbi:MAG: hypothetical protein WA323_17915 [Candidatus Nitrosopolaris sp.]